jgi:predicted outer membrane repeat protein
LNCEFSNNSASRDGGVIYSSPDASLKLTNCQLSNNSAGLEGGGIYASSHSSLILTNCILSNNSAAGDGGGIFFGGSDYSTLTSTLTNCLFKNNSAKEGGGIYSNRSLNLTNCVLTNNSASRGGGIYISRTLTLTNCVLTNNSAGSGGGIYAISSYSTSNSVFTKNYARLHGSGIYSNLSPTEESPPSIINCIFWKNKTGLSFVHGVQAARTFTHWKSIILQDEVQEKYPGDPNARDTVYEPNLNILQGWDGDARAFDADPLFVNIDNPIGPDGIWFTDDDGLRVVDGSPAIGAGHNDSLPSDVSDLDSDENTTEPIPYDALGKARRIGAKVDIGAYEFDAANPPPVVKLALSLIAESGGSVNGGGYFEEGVDANISATASIGYIFSNWSGDASGSLNPLTITVDSAKNITANFTQDLNDTDGDDLTNYAELVTHGTKVDDNDTDNDGLLDNEEIQIGTDPNISNSNIVNFLNSKASSDQDNARNAGQTEGIDMVKANPSEYNLVAKSSYDQALQDANASAEQAIADAKASAMEEGIELVKADPSNYGLYSSADLDATLLYALSDANATADQSIADAKVLAKAEGIEEGKALGENSVTSNPSAYNLVFKSSYEQALLDANASAEQAIADAKDSAKEEGVDLVKANPKTFGLYSSTDLNASIESALSEARPATAEAIANAKAEGIEEGKALGKSEGESSVTSNPSAYNLVTQDAYDQMIGELISSSETNATHYTEGWFYNPSRGWMWTNREAYPYFYDATDKDWIYFQSGNDKPKFYRYKTKTWLTVE